MRHAAFLAFIPLLVACSGSTSPSGAGGDTTGSGHGTFTCGGGTCDIATQVCDRAALDEGTLGVTYEYSCIDLAAPCLTDHTCACVKSHGGFFGCSEDGDGGITVDSDLP